MTNILVLGGIIIDKYNFINKYPKCGTDTFINESFDVPGGCSLNVAVTLKNLGITPYIFSKVGFDNDGQRIKSYLETRRIGTDYIVQVDATTDYCLVMVDQSGERTFFTHDKLDRAIPNEMMDAMLSMDYDSVYVTGYFMVQQEKGSNALKIIEKLAEKGTKILFDPGAIVGEIDADDLRTLIKLADILTPNRHEEDAITKILGASLSSLVKESCYLISKDGGNELIIKQGKNIKAMNPFKAQVVDTTGAGDSFAAGVLYGLSLSDDIGHAVEIAMACGALTTTYKEPHGDFGIDEINETIKNGSVKYEK